MSSSYPLDHVPSDVVGKYVGQLNTYIDNETLVYTTAIADRDNQIRDQIRRDSDEQEARGQLEITLSDLSTDYEILKEHDRWQSNEIATLSDGEAKSKTRETELCKTIDRQAEKLRTHYTDSTGMKQELQEQAEAKDQLLQQFHEHEADTKRRWNESISSTKATTDEYIHKLTGDLQQLYDSNRAHVTARLQAKTLYDAARTEAETVHQKDIEERNAIQSQNDELMMQNQTNKQRKLEQDSNSRATQAQLQQLMTQARSFEQQAHDQDSNTRSDQAKLQQLRDELTQAYETIAGRPMALATPHKSNIDTPSANTQVGGRPYAC
jgi:hypothetical protein